MERLRMLVERQRTERERREDAKGTRSFQERYFYCKVKTRGIFLALSNCGIKVGYRELYGTESIRQGRIYLLKHDGP